MLYNTTIFIYCIFENYFECIKLETFDQSSTSERDVASFTVMNLNQNFSINVKNALVGTIFSGPDELPPKKDVVNKYPHLRDIRFNELDDPSVGLILDAKFAHSFMTGEIRTGKENEPMAFLSRYGWVLVGPSVRPDNDNDGVIESSLYTLSSEPVSVLDEINKMFRYDFLMRPSENHPPQITHMSVMDEDSLEQMKKGIVMNEDTGHYSVPLSYVFGREETAKIFKKVDFLSNARSRQSKLKVKFEKDPVLREGAFKQIQETLDLGHAKILTDLSAPEASPVCYLPNHVVTRPDKPGKFRICQDAAARVNGHFLNKYLHTGPDVLNNLLGILLRFRRKRVVLSADIRTFFYQVEVDPIDQPCLRYLWWASEKMDKEIVIQALVHIFGAAPSPAIANFVLRHHAEQIKDKYPISVYLALLFAMYVDDYLDSIESPEEARKQRILLTEALALGGFEITKWQSNYPEVLLDDNEAIDTPSIQQEVDLAAGGRAEQTTSGPLDPDAESPKDGITSSPAEEEDEEQELTLDDLDWNPEDPSNIGDLVDHAFKSENKRDVARLMTQESTGKVLGVGYNFDSDTLSVRVGDKHSRVVKTMAELLSFVCSVYDPLGIVSPYVVKGRMFFQQVMQLKIDWKANVPEEILTEFDKWKDSIIHLVDVKISRWTSILGFEDSRTELICFCDASRVGYCAVFYIKRSLKGGCSDQCHVEFMFGKSHVVPLNMLERPTEGQEAHTDSIPRLELVAAKLAVLWRDVIERESGETFDHIWMFSDSLTVLNWLIDYNRRFYTFENFRIKFVRKFSKPNEWRHCPTHLNPADVGSKGVNADDKRLQFYLQGPDFIRLDESQWPPVRPVKANDNNGNSVSSKTTIASASASVVDTDLEKLYNDSVIIPYQILVVNSAVVDSEAPIESEEVEPWPLRLTCRQECWISKVRIVGIVRKCILKLKERVDMKKNGVTETRLRPKKKDGNGKKSRVILSQEEKLKAELILLRAIQCTAFSKEIETIIKLGIFTPNALRELRTKNSQIKSLSPFLDSSNLLRAGGRYGKADYLSYDSRFPIILPGSKDENVKSLIRHYHENDHHSTRTQTFYSLRFRFHILGGKTSVGRVINKCVTCQSLHKNPPIQRLGDLPEDRVKMAAPFQVSGLDIFGPWSIRHGGRGTHKRWVLLATCFCTRAICLIPLRDMSAATVINALIKMNSQFPSLQKVH